MKKSYTKLVMLLLAMVGCMTASADDNLVELDESMFKAWTTAGADAEELDLSIEENKTFVNGTETFGCEVNYFRNVDGGNVIYGNGNVIWQWYADLSKVKKMYFTGEKGLAFRLLYNRQPAQDGDTDNHGHQCPETVVTIGDDGTAVFDVEQFKQNNSLEYFHVNCMKIQWGAQAMKFKKVMLEGDIQGSGKVYTPLDGMTGSFQYNVTSINLGSQTNLLTLLNGRERLIFPTENATVKVNGVAQELMSVEGMMVNGNARIFMFMSDYTIDDSEQETADVKLSFTNPTDEAQKIMFNFGRFEGEALPNITDMAATFEDHVGEYYPNAAKIPEVDSADPELNSINLPVGTTQFKVKFTGKADLSKLTAKFDDAPMTVSPNTGLADEVTLTRAAGDVANGVHTITIENIIPEMDWFEDKGTATLKYSFGITDIGEGIKTYMKDNFTESGNGTVPASWNVLSDGDVRTGATGLWGGCRLIGVSGSFAPVVLYLCSRGVASGGYANYGANDEKLTLEPNTYHLKYEAARWDGSGTRGLKVQVVSEEVKDGEGNIVSGGEIIAEQLTPVNTDRNIEGQCNKGDLEFTVTEAGNYILKFFPTDANGNPAGYGDGLAVANIKVQTIPDVMGIYDLVALQDAMDVAKTAKNAAEGERFAGDTYTALDNVITKYTNTPPTAPSSFDGAVKELTDAAKAMDAHRKLCEDFDKLPADLLTNMDKYAETKFATQSIYEDLVNTFNKYATIETEEIEVDAVMQTVRYAKPKNITADDELQAGITEMTAANAKVAMFTEGASTNGTKGYAALHERLRRGIETAEALGISESNPAVAAAIAELGDNDEVANALKAEIAKALEEVTEVTEPIDMTVFIKNPNIYVTTASENDFSDGAAPGWTITGESISGNWGLAGGSGTHIATNDVPADEALTISSPVVVTQEITDLPNGTYQVTAFLGDRRGQDDFINNSGVKDDTKTVEENLAAAKAKVYPMEYLFINTSATAEGAYDNKTQVQSNGVSWGVKDENKIVSKKFTVTDGKITLGVRNEGSPAWFAFNEIRIELVPNSVIGDVNNDNKITMADANLIVNYYLAPGNYPNFPVEAADLNDDDEITMADANAVVNIYLAGESE
ncbi:MAG: hypothetical protein II844_02270 [Prevotella sp.]|nr:hypothetical protein [Prevotella sp.]